MIKWLSHQIGEKDERATIRSRTRCDHFIRWRADQVDDYYVLMRNYLLRHGVEKFAADRDALRHMIETQVLLDDPPSFGLGAGRELRDLRRRREEVLDGQGPPTARDGYADFV